MSLSFSSPEAIKAFDSSEIGGIKEYFILL
jgi:hypothetical protein